jgi:hypothetical protein
MRRSNLVAVLGVLLAVCGALSVATTAQAAIVTLTDGNSSTSIDASTPVGQFNWLVDGVNQTFQQGFWFRIGDAGDEQALSTVPLVSAGTAFGDTVAQLHYKNPGVMDVLVNYTLLGGSLGSHSSDLGESIRVINLGASTMSLHFFQYVDFDLNGSAGGNYLRFVDAHTVDQWGGGGAVLSETVVTPMANHFEGKVYPTTLLKFSDGLPTTLADAPPVGTVLGPADVTWAYEWDVDIAPGDNFTISKDKMLSAVPEPATIIVWSLLSGFAIAFGWRRFR